MKSYKIFLNKIKSLKNGFKFIEIGAFDTNDKNKYSLICLETKRDLKKYNVLISAGIHGDEPAAVYGLLEFIENKIRRYVPYFNFYIFPCLNPTGFETNKRKNFENFDLNRDFKNTKSTEINLLKKYLLEKEQNYKIVLNLHEDNTFDIAKGSSMKDNPKNFYMYEISKKRDLELGVKIIKKLKNKGATISKKTRIYNDIAKNGLIKSGGKGDPKYSDENTFERFSQRFSHLILTPETPTCWPFQKRIKIQVYFLEAALDELLKEEGKW
jgi:hypothetical protein